MIGAKLTMSTRPIEELMSDESSETLKATNAVILSFREFRIRYRMIGFQNTFVFRFFTFCLAYSESLILLKINTATTIAKIIRVKMMEQMISVAPKL